MADPSALTNILQVAVTVDELEAGIVYHRDVLGLPLLFRAGNMAFFQCGGTRLLVGTENTAAQRTFLYFGVGDIHAAHKRLAAAGVPFEEEPRVIARLPDREVWLAAFRAPDGALHHIMSEVERAPARA